MSYMSTKNMKLNYFQTLTFIYKQCILFHTFVAHKLFLNHWSKYYQYFLILQLNRTILYYISSNVKFVKQAKKKFI